MRSWLGETMAAAGEWAAMGARLNGIGAVHVYRLQADGTYALFTSLTVPGDTLNGVFGLPVALRNNSLLVGSSSSRNSRGAAFLFTFDGTTWTLAHRFEAADTRGAASGYGGDRFGSSVAFVGERVAVGSFPNNIYAGEGEAVYVFNPAGGAWQQEARLSTGTSSADPLVFDATAFGMVLDADSTGLVVGAWVGSADDGAGGKSSGAAYFYTPGNWTSPTVVAVPSSVGRTVGRYVALSGRRALLSTNGTSVLTVERDASGWARTGSFTSPVTQPRLGLKGATALVAGLGQAHWYMLQNGTATLHSSFETLIPSSALVQAVATTGSDFLFGVPTEGAVYYATWRSSGRLALGIEHPAGDGLGTSVALSGNVLATGAPGADRRVGQTVPQSLTEGQVHVFVRTDGAWQEQGVLHGEAAEGLGRTVALQGDLLAAGGKSGVRVFGRSNGTWTPREKLLAGQTPGATLALGGDVLVVGEPNDTSVRGRATVYTCGTMCSAPTGLAEGLASGEVNLGRSVAVSPDGQYVLLGTGLGALAFRRDGSTWVADITPRLRPAGTASGVALGTVHAALLTGAFGQAHLHLYGRTASGWSREDSVAIPGGYANALAAGPSAFVVSSAATRQVYVVAKQEGRWQVTTTLPDAPASNVLSLAFDGVRVAVGEAAAGEGRGAVFVQQLGTSTAVTPPPGVAAARLRLHGPNPIAPGTRVSVTLGTPGVARLELFDAIGRRVALLHSGPLPADEQAFPLPDKLGSGIYFVRLSTEGPVEALPLVNAAR